MKALKPVPTPWSAFWRELRYRYLPTVVFVTLLIGVGSMWRQFVPPTSLVPDGSGSFAKRTPGRAGSTAKAGNSGDCPVLGVIHASAGSAPTNASFTNCSQPSNTYSHSAGAEAIKIKELPRGQPLSGQVQ